MVSFYIFSRELWHLTHLDQSILLFPPVNNYRRFLIHQSCEEFRKNHDLITFSVGQNLQRRTVICWRNQLLDPVNFQTTSALHSETRRSSRVKSWRSDNNQSATQRENFQLESKPSLPSQSSIEMGVEKHLTMETPSTAKLNKSHSVDIYRPPPLRRSKIESIPSCSTETELKNFNNGDLDRLNSMQQKQQSDDSSENSHAATMISNEQQQRRRERRPDRAVYIPRARRSQTTPPSVVAVVNHNSVQHQHQQQQQQQELQKHDLININQLQNESVLAKSSSKTDATGAVSAVASEITKCRSNHHRKNKNRKERKSLTNQNEIINNRLNRVDSESSGCGSDQCSLQYSGSCSGESEKIMKKECDNFENNSEISLIAATPTTTQADGLQNSIDSSISSSSSSALYNHQVTNMSSMDCGGDNCDSTSDVILSTNSNSNLLRIEDVGRHAADDALRKCDFEAEELQRASKEINRSNRRIIKQTFTSDILEIPENISNNIQPSIGNKMSSETKIENVPSPTKPIETMSKANNTALSTTTDEDDWDSMFDENGECLDPKIIQELSDSVGKVKIELPKMDYSAFLTKQSILNEEEFPHVLEVSNFPVEFKTPDLLMIFSQYKESGFDIKWVDDTHALAVFSSSRIAAEVLTMGHPFVVLKPLAEATVESRIKAQKCATSLQPYRPRPETCAALARRLVTGALGVRLKTAAAERENEKRVLREAKERKLLAAKQRDDVWES